LLRNLQKTTTFFMAQDPMTEEQPLHPDSEGFVCDVCGDTFDSISALEDHKHDHLHPLRSHDDDRYSRGDIGAAGLPTAP
jgi:hypothetical protein